MKNIKGFLQRLHQDDRGDIPVGNILIIGLIAIPLVIALIAFGDAIMDWLADQWAKVSGKEVKGTKTF